MTGNLSKKTPIPSPVRQRLHRHVSDQPTYRILKQRQPSACNGEWRDKRFKTSTAPVQVASFFLNRGEVLEPSSCSTVAGGISDGHEIASCAPKRAATILTHNDRADPARTVFARNAMPQPAFAREISRKPGPYARSQRLHLPDVWRRCRRTPSLRSTRKRVCTSGTSSTKAWGSDEPANLRAIRSVCNEGASNVTLTRPDLQKLLVQIRRATTADQLEVLEWLRKPISQAS